MEFIKYFGHGQEDDGDDVGGLPVGLAKGAIDSGLDVLDPAGDVESAGDQQARGRVAEVFGKGVEAGKGGGDEDDGDGAADALGGEVGDGGKGEGEVGEGGEEAAVEAGVVAKNRGVGVDGEKGGEDLRGQKEEQDKIKRGFLIVDFALGDHAGSIEAANDCGHGVDKEHFGEFKEFGGVGGPQKRGGKEGDIDREDNGGIEIT